MNTAIQSPFLQRLQAEAALQARLEAQRVLPSKLDFLTSFIGRYPWQVLLSLSGFVAIGLEILDWWKK